MTISNGASDVTLSVPDHHSKRQDFMGVPFDDVDFNQTVEMIKATRGQPGFRYVVTPNVDHIVRLSGSDEFMKFYRAAWLSLCDSKPVALIARRLGVRLPRVTGSDLTACLFTEVLKPDDRITIIAPDMDVADDLQAKFSRLQLRSYVPPFGVGEKPDELRKCVEFTVAEPSDFIFLAIGAPQSEKIAYMLAQDQRASGTAFCIGASLEFLTEKKKRAPRWMSKAGVEWLHRLASDPRRLWRRYLFSVAPLAGLSLTEYRKRRAERRNH